MPLTGRHVVVTGGAGFIGSHVLRPLLQRGADVTVIDNLTTGSAENLPSQAKLVEADIRHLDGLRDLLCGADVVIHLAAVSSVAQCQDELFAAHSVNLGGVLAVIQAVRDAAPDAPILFASSAAVYGTPAALPIAETAPCRAQSFYGLDKQAGEQALAMACTTYGLRATVLRLFNAYGIRQNPHSPYAGVISTFAERLRTGQPVTIYGNGDQSRDFIRAEDVAEHFVAAAAHALGQPAGATHVLNSCTGRATSVRTVFDHIAAHYGVAQPAAFAARRNEDILHSVGDPTRVLSTLGTPPSVSFEAGLAAFLKATTAKELGPV